MTEKHKKRENEDKIKVFLVDDDAVFLKLSKIELLQHADFDIETYTTGESCLQNLGHNPDVIVLDYSLDGFDKHAMSGISTLDKIKRYNSDIPVVILSCQDEIDVAVNCMHHRAFDYVVKNDTFFVRLQKVITDIFKYKNMEKQLNWYLQSV